MDISKDQYKMLKQIKKSNVNTSGMSEYEIDICKFLMDKKFLKAREFSHYDRITNSVYVERSLPDELELTQAGEAQLYSYKASFHHWWIPVAVSILSAAVSLASALWQVLKELAPQMEQVIK